MARTRTQRAEKPTLGFIGLGKMGMPLARRLVEAGHDVIAFDIDAKAVDSLARSGAARGRSPKDVGSRADIVFSCLPALKILTEVVLGESGICRGQRVNTFVDFSTTGPGFAAALSRELAKCMAEAEKLGVTMLIGNMARQLWSYGVHHGGAKNDSSTLITYLEDWAGVKVIGKAARSAGK